MTTANVNVTKVLLKRGNTAQNNNYTGVSGELTIDTQLKTLRVHDGVTAGGNAITASGAIGSYSNTNTAAYLASQSITSANIGAFQTFANANAATQTTSINTVNANIGAYQTYANSNAATQATSIDSINANVGAFQTFANANAATQTTEINSLRANITAANTAITNLTSNAAIQATLLDTLTGNAATQSQVLDTLTSNAAAQASSLTTLLGNAVAQQTSLIDLVANAATQAQAIASVTGTYSNANVSTYLSAFDGNILPAANVTYSLGSETRQWRDLWVSNNTIYIGNTPVRVDGGTLLVNGAPVGGTYGNTQVAAYLPIYTGNIAGNIVKNGNVWTFGTNGTTTFPTNISINYSAGNVQFPRIIADTGKAFSIQAQGNTGSAALSWTVNPDAAGQYAAVAVTKGGGDNLAKVVLTAQSDSGDAATAKTWTFNQTGTTRFPGDTILAPAGVSVTMQSDQYSQLMWENANVTVAPNMAINSNFYVAQNNATLDIVYRDGSSNQQQKSWLWGVNGSMTLPAGGVIAEGGGLTGAIRLTPAGGANSNQALLIYPTGFAEGDHVHLTAGGGSTELYLGNDYHYVKLVDGGNIELRAATANLSAQAAWTFDTTGNVDTIQALGIKVPNGVPSDVVDWVGGGGWNSPPYTNLATTGGTGTGLTVNVSTAAGGYIDINAITINNPGTGYTNGDIITITNENSIPGTFTIVIAGRNTWQFGTGGNLTMPQTGYLRVGSGIVAGSLVASPAPVISGFSSISAENFKFSGNGVNILSNLYANAAVQSANIATINNTLTSTTVAIGYGAGQTSQGGTTVAIGAFAGMTTQGLSAVAVGFNAGQTSQGTLSVAIGMTAGYDAQGNGAVAIGVSAGYTNQGAQAIAIGKFAGLTNQGNNSIIINATTGTLNQTTANTFTVAPVRNDVANVAQIMFYNTTSKEITYGNTISIAGNVNASQFNFANGVNILSTVAGTYANANVASYLLHFDGDIEFTSSTAKIGNVDVITVMDNIQSPAYRFSNGVNILSTVANTYLPTYSGNVSAVNFVGAIQAQVGSSFAYSLNAFGAGSDTGGVFLPADINSNAVVAGYTIVSSAGVTLTVTSASFVAGTPDFVTVATTPTASSFLYPATVYSDNYSPAVPTSTITVGNATVTGNITAGNVAGTTLTGNLSGRVLTATQSSITSLGTLTNVNTSGNVNATNTVTAGTVTATGNVNASNTVNTNAAIVSGNITAGNIKVNGTGSALSQVAVYGSASANASLGMYNSIVDAGAQIYLGDNNFNTSTKWNSAPGIGATYDSSYGGLAGALGLYTYAGNDNSRTLRVTVDAQQGGVQVHSNAASYSTTTGALKIGGGVGIGGNLHVGGNITQQSAYYETYSNVTNSGGNLTCNFVDGTTFYATLTANVTANFTNVVATAGRVTGATLIVDQGATAYRVANLQINSGGIQTIKYAGATPNTGTASNTDVMSFSLISLDGTNWRVLGQISNYG